MGRRKISIRRIADDRNRHVTFIKRNNGLLKKAMELALLCGCDISLIVISDSGKATTFSTGNLIDAFDRIQAGVNIKEHNAFNVGDYVKFSTDTVDRDEEGSDMPSTSPTEGVHFAPNSAYSSMPDTRATDSLIAAMMMRNDGVSTSHLKADGSSSSYSNYSRPKPVHPPGLSETTRNNKRHRVEEESKSSVTALPHGESTSATSKWNNYSTDDKSDHVGSQEVEVATILASSAGKGSHSFETTDSPSMERETVHDASVMRPERKRPHHAIEENPFLAPNRADYSHPSAYNPGYYGGGHPMMYFPQARHPHGQGYMVYPNSPADMRPLHAEGEDRPGGGSNRVRNFQPNVMVNPMSMNPMNFDPNFQQMLASQYMMAQQANMFNNHPAHHHSHHAPNVPGDGVEEEDGEGVLTADV